MYILLEKTRFQNPDRQARRDRTVVRGTAAVIGKRIRFRCNQFDHRSEKAFAGILEDTAYDQERVLLLLQKIAEKYQYKDFEFKHDIRQNKNCHIGQPGVAVLITLTSKNSWFGKMSL